MPRSLLLVRLGLPLFYGYVILLVATIGKILSAPGQSPCIGVVVDCVMVSLGLSRSVTSALYLVATVGSAATLPTVGRLVDRHGVQTSITVVSVLLGLACMLLSICESAVLLLLCFYLLRLLGQGAIMLVSQNAINLWFVRLRGLVMGIAAAGASMGVTALVPSAMAAGIDSIGWRPTYRVLGLVCLGFSALGFAFYREKPELYALRPDGDSAALAASDSAAEAADEQRQGALGAKGEAGKEGDADEEPAWTRAEALRTGAFWAISFGCLSIGLTATAFWFHLNRIITDRLGVTAPPSLTFEGSGEEPGSGIDGGHGDGGTNGSVVRDAGSGEASAGADEGTCGVRAAPEIMTQIYTVLAISSTISRVGGGFLADRVAPRLLLASALLLQALSLALVLVSNSIGMVLLVCTSQGVSQALMGSVSGVVYANFYGRANLGAIGGVAKSMVVLGSALGPFPFGAVRDMTGSFDPALLASVVLSLVCCGWALRHGRAPVQARRPGKPRPGLGVAVELANADEQELEAWAET
jgi:sugar phosphate permease